MLSDKLKRVVALDINPDGELMIIGALFVKENYGLPTADISDNKDVYRIRIPDNLRKKDFAQLATSIAVPYEKLNQENS